MPERMTSEQLNEQQRTTKTGERTTGTNEQCQVQSVRTTMPKRVIYWLVSPSFNVVTKLQQTTLRGAYAVYETMKANGFGPSDLTLCTNECRTTFANGVYFSNGKLYGKD